MSVIVPASTCGRKASCCALLKRWISSTNRIVPRPQSSRRPARLGDDLADARHAFASPRENGTNSRSVYVRDQARERRLARARAGPRRPSSRRVPFSIASRSGLPGASRCALPDDTRRACADACAPRAAAAAPLEQRPCRARSPRRRARVCHARAHSPAPARAPRSTTPQPATKLERNPPSRTFLKLRHEIRRADVQRHARGEREPVASRSTASLRR